MQMHMRSNTTLELTVRYGLVIDYDLGAVHAWTFMANSGVPDRVILRVLSEATNRREDDQLALNTAVESQYLHQQAKSSRGLPGRSPNSVSP